MKKNQKNKWQPVALAAVLFGFVSADAQVFTFHNNDLILGFRKNAPFTESYEAVVDIGQASTFINQAVGTTVTISGYSASVLSPGSFTSLNNLSWSVFGTYSGSGYSGYIADNTLWLTVARTNNSVKSVTPYRLANNILQGGVASPMLAISGPGGAGYISLNDPAGQYNTATYVRESLATYGGHTLSTWLAGSVNTAKANFNDSWPADEPNSGNLENTTPGSFSGTVRSDLYEVRPLSTRSGPDVDPHVGTNSTAWYVGYFEFKSDGSMTFTRDVVSTVQPPPPPVLSLTRTGLVSTISFVSSNSATYKLFFTNAAGLTTPASTWPSLPGTITGNGAAQSFQDTTTDPNRVYRVQAH